MLRRFEEHSPLRLGIRAKLFLLSFTVIAISIGASYLVLRSLLDTLFTGQVAGDLAVRAELLSREASLQTADTDDIAQWDSMADVWGKTARVRATLVLLDGRVIGDSALSCDALRRAEPHSMRPEVREALATGQGGAQRLSGTAGQRMLYVAVPFRRGGRVAGVARVALSLNELDAAMGELDGIITLTMVLALVLAAFLATAASHLASRTARELTVAARRMAAGDLTARAPANGGDEFGALGKALDTLATNLSESMGQLRSERDRFGGILAGMQEGVLLLRADGRIALVNPALREMLLLQGEVTGRLAVEVVQHEELARLLSLAISSHQAVSREIAFEALKPRRLLVRAAPLGAESDGVFAVFVDVTEVRRLEGVRKDFVANVSHELRTPVTAIRSAAETLSGILGSGSAVGHRFLDIVERNAARLADLVEDLLDLSKIEAKTLKLALEPVDLDASFAQIIELFRDRAERRGVRLISDVERATPRAIADSRALENVLSNLVDNAVKYAGAGAEVRLVASPDDDGIRVCVADTGSGIEARHLPRIFERFYRVDTGRSRELGGTGLGLSIVKHLVEAMGSQVTVESAPGEGTRFSFVLRRATDIAESDEQRV